MPRPPHTDIRQDPHDREIGRGCRSRRLLDWPDPPPRPGELASGAGRAPGLGLGHDVESSDARLTHWAQLALRFDLARDFARAAGRGKGWDDLDARLVGNAATSDLTLDERQSAMPLWAIACSPLDAGDDLLRLDPAGLALLINDELIAINQAGIPARPILNDRHRPVPVWTSRQDDGSHVVALFNCDGRESREVEVPLADLDLPGPARVCNLWSHQDLGLINGKIAASPSPLAPADLSA